MQFHQNRMTGIRASQKEKDLNRLLCAHAALVLGVGKTTELADLDLFHYVLYHSLHYVPLEKKYLRLISIHLLLAHLMLFCQSIDLVITIDTFYWLSKSPLSQSEALLNKSRSALLECAIHVFNSVSLCSPFLHGRRDPPTCRKCRKINFSFSFSGYNLLFGNFEKTCF